MKTSTFLIFLLAVFASCSSAKYQQMQKKRDQLRAAHEDARRKHDPRQLETALTDKLIGTWQFLDMEVAEGDVSEEIAALKYARRAADRQNLILEFFMDRNVFRRYRCKNGDIKATGSFKISTMRYGDEPFPFLRVFRDTGDPLSQIIFGMSESRLEREESSSKKKSPGASNNTLGISVMDDTLHIILFGVMELTPNGWAQSGGIRCTFKRIQ